ncbi:signal-regulatory protein beta-1-like [Dromaius novaehollandiae]|uniref:signal-regulatory protein beta-1-like n=1 Tax=Dromaius novaehollandiae TaxID=8790 RepID=UPI00311EBC7B
MRPPRSPRAGSGAGRQRDAGLACLLLLLLCRAPGAGAQEDESFHLWQPQGQVSVSVGQTLTLHCTVSRHAIVGPVKWLKAFGSSKQIVYDPKGPFPRVTRAVNESNTNYTIHISKVRVEDAGTYYCVKFKKGEEQDEEYSSGAGTEVFVHASPTSVAVSGPEHRAEPGSLARFTCTAGGFFPRDISVEWLKNGAPVRAPGPRVTAGQTNSSYDMVSAVELTLRAADVRSQLTCVVKHSTLPAPLRQTYNLSDAVRVPPTVRVLPDLPNPVEVHKTVNFTCSAEGFYPDAVTLTWLENGVEANAGSPPHLTETSQGTFELRSLLEVQATEEKNQSVFTCRVVHDSQSPVSSAVTLQIAVPAADRGPNNESLADQQLLSLAGLYVGLLLEKGLLGLVLFFLFKRRMQ